MASLHHTHKKILAKFTCPFDFEDASRKDILNRFRRYRQAIDATTDFNCDWFTRMVAKAIRPVVEEAIATIEQAPEF